MQEIKEGYTYEIEVPICMIGHYGSDPNHKMNCTLGYNSSDGTVHYFYNNEEGQTIDYTIGSGVSVNYTVVTKLAGKGKYDKDGNPYWLGSQTEKDVWKSDEDILSSENGLNHGKWGTSYEPGSGGTPVAFYKADYTDEHSSAVISGPSING